MTVYAAPAGRGSGEFVAPVDGRYFESPTSMTGQVYATRS